MATTEQTSPTSGEHRDEVSNVSGGPSTQRGSEANNSASGISPVPQPFHAQHQPAYVPYAAGQPFQPITYGAPVRLLPNQSAAYINTKLGLTVLCLTWDVIIIALTSVLVSQNYTVQVAALYAYPIAVASILWNSADLITYCVRMRKQVKRAIHPGAHVGLHLIFWLVGVLATFLTVTVYIAAAAVAESCSDNRDDDDRYYYYYCPSELDTDFYKGTLVSVVRALVAFFALWTITHFVLFVLACIDTHKRNALRPQAVVMPVKAEGGAYPQQQQPGAAQPMLPVQYYPYPVTAQPQPQPQSAPTGQQPAQDGQHLAGFYAPAPERSAQAA
ncbi:hypothetical protein F4802DRAFT_116609 [Xylaria palmicola]|nr:hypothetical protein F4802DRAFT_116609 [Xylaria palmicola]